MAITFYPSNYTGATGTWTTPEKAYNDDSVYAYSAPSAKNTSSSITYGGFNFSSIPSNATINSLKFQVEWRDSTTSSIATLNANLTINGISCGSVTRDYNNEVIVDTIDFLNITGLVSVSDLRTNNAIVDVQITRGNSNTAFTGYIDYVAIIVDYVCNVSVTESKATSAVSAKDATITAVIQKSNLATVDNVTNNVSAKLPTVNAFFNGFSLERKTGVGGTWERIAIVDIGATQYQDTNVVSGNTYYYRVQRGNGVAISDYSNEYSFDYVDVATGAITVTVTKATNTLSAKDTSISISDSVTVTNVNNTVNPKDANVSTTRAITVGVTNTTNSVNPKDSTVIPQRNMTITVVHADNTVTPKDATVQAQRIPVVSVIFATSTSVGKVPQISTGALLNSNAPPSTLTAKAPTVNTVRVATTSVSNVNNTLTAKDPSTGSSTDCKIIVGYIGNVLTAKDVVATAPKTIDVISATNTVTAKPSTGRVDANTGDYSQGYETNGLLLNLDARSSSLTTFKDVSGNNHNATLYNFGDNPWQNNGLVFDGINDHAIIPSYAPISGDDDFTFEIYLETPVQTISNLMFLAQFGTAGSNYFVFYFDPDGIMLGIGNASYGFLGQNLLPTANTKTHYVIRRTGTTTKTTTLWINGVLTGTRTDARNPNPITTTENYYIGTYRDEVSYPFNGTMYLQRWYDRGLTDSEIVYNYSKINEIPQYTVPVSTSDVQACVPTVSFGTGVSNSVSNIANTLTANAPTIATTRVVTIGVANVSNTLTAKNTTTNSTTSVSIGITNVNNIVSAKTATQIIPKNISVSNVSNTVSAKDSSVYIESIIGVSTATNSVGTTNPIISTPRWYVQDGLIVDYRAVPTDGMNRTGNKLPDFSGNGYDGTLYSMLNDGITSGWASDGIIFDAIDDNLSATIPTTSMLVKNQYTVEFIIDNLSDFSDATTNWYWQFGWGGKIVTGWQGWTKGWTTHFYTDAGVRSYFDTVYNVVPNNRYHVISMYDGDNLIIYCNNVKIGQKTVGNLPLPTNSSFSISASYSKKMKLLVARVYNKALSEAEIALNFQADIDVNPSVYPQITNIGNTIIAKDANVSTTRVVTANVTHVDNTLTANSVATNVGGGASVSVSSATNALSAKDANVTPVRSVSLLEGTPATNVATAKDTVISISQKNILSYIGNTLTAKNVNVSATRVITQSVSAVVNAITAKDANVVQGNGLINQVVHVDNTSNAIAPTVSTVRNNTVSVTNVVNTLNPKDTNVSVGGGCVIGVTHADNTVSCPNVFIGTIRSNVHQVFNAFNTLSAKDTTIVTTLGAIISVDHTDNTITAFASTSQTSNSISVTASNVVNPIKACTPNVSVSEMLDITHADNMTSAKDVNVITQVQITLGVENVNSIINAKYAYASPVMSVTNSVTKATSVVNPKDSTIKPVKNVNIDVQKSEGVITSIPAVTAIERTTTADTKQMMWKEVSIQVDMMQEILNLYKQSIELALQVTHSLDIAVAVSKEILIDLGIERSEDLTVEITRSEDIDIGIERTIDISVAIQRSLDMAIQI